MVNNVDDKYYLTLVLRLLVDKQGNLYRGVMVDLNQKQVNQFHNLESLPNLVAGWLNTWTQGNDAPNLDNLP